MGNMFQVYRDFEDAVLGARSLEEARKLNPAVQTFKTFVRTNTDKILAAMAPASATTRIRALRRRLGTSGSRFAARRRRLSGAGEFVRVELLHMPRAAC